MTFYRVTYL